MTAAFVQLGPFKFNYHAGVLAIDRYNIYICSVPCLLHQQNTALTVILTAISHDGCVVLANRSQGQYHTNDTSSNCKMCQLPIPNECIYPKKIYVCMYIYIVYMMEQCCLLYIYIQMHFENQFDQGMFVFRVDLGSFV